MWKDKTDREAELECELAAANADCAGWKKCALRLHEENAERLKWEYPLVKRVDELEGRFNQHTFDRERHVPINAKPMETDSDKLSRIIEIGVRGLMQPTESLRRMRDALS